MATTGDLYKGAFLRFNNELVQVLEYEHRTPGNLRAFYQVKMRNVRTGKLAEHRFRAGETLEFVRVETRDYMYSYREGENLVCIDNETFEQVVIPKVVLGDAIRFLKEGTNLKISFTDEGEAVMAQMPQNVELEVTYTEPGVKGDTATKALKPATLETGATIQVPLFVDNGEKIRINTETGEYVERVK
ncbi:MAG: elongation factor P [Microscillaceae bacterium]|nr:elongation factor P [Microscillaceae bacterium]MDW8461663.1 elongation factor P [Cytophagales bacterium]